MSRNRRIDFGCVGAIVALSFLARLVIGWLRATPALFPDEYTYAALGRSLAESGRPLIRGASPHFPALLQPIVTAPAWLVDDVATSFRIVQGIGAFAMSLAAIPAYLLARRLSLGRPVSLAIAALTVLAPDLVYASYVSSEPLAYPLVLAALLAGVAALVRPRKRTQIAFVLFAALATLARVQFVVLPLVFAGATLAIGLRERRVRAAVREQLLPIAAFAVPALALFATGPQNALGPYRTTLGLAPRPLDVGRWIALDAMTLTYAAGWILVPGALLGLWLAFRRPESREELAFAAMTALLAGALLVESGILQASLPLVNEIQERYVFYLVPAIGTAFALYARRGWPHRIPHLALAAALVLVSVRVPLSGFAIAATLDGSPILFGVYWLAGQLGEPGAASAIVAITVAVISAVAVGMSRRPKLATPVTLALAVAFVTTASAGAVAFDTSTSKANKRVFLASDPSWIDRTGVKNVSLLASYGGIQISALQQLFWNRSIDRVLMLPGAGRVDAFGGHRVKVADDGTLLLAGHPLHTPLVVDGYGSTVTLRGARQIAAGPMSALWVPDGEPRLALYAIGRYYDGWLADAGSVFIWPATPGGRLQGWLTIDVVAPKRADKPVVLTMEGPGGTKSSLRLEPGERGTARLAVCGRGSASTLFRSSLRGMVNLRVVSVRSSPPQFVPDSGACTARPRRSLT